MRRFLYVEYQPWMTLKKKLFYFSKTKNSFLSLSRKGLELRNKLNANNEDESCFLNEIENIINKSETPSEKLASRYKNVYNNNLNNLLKNEAF